MPGIYSNIGGASPSTITFRVGTATIDRGSTTEHQEILVVGDPISSLAQARVMDAVPASTDWGVITRLVGYSTVVQVSSVGGVVAVTQNSTVWAVQAAPITISTPTSTAAPASNDTGVVVRQVGYSTTAQVSSVGGVVAVTQNSTTWAVQVGAMTIGGPISTAAPASNDTGVVVRQVGYSTVAQVSSVGGVVAVSPNSTVWAVQVAGYSTTAQVSSVAGVVLVSQNSTVWQTQAAVRTSSGGSVEGSTASPAQGVLGLHVRTALSSLQSTTVQVTSSNSTAVYSLISSAAGLKQKVYAYFIGSTTTVPSTLIFMSSLTIDRWAVMFGSGSSGVTGANLSVTPPAFLFESDAANAVTCRVESGSTGQVTRLGLSWFAEP